MKFSDKCKVDSLKREQRNIVDRLCTVRVGLKERAQAFDDLRHIQTQLQQYGC